MHESIKVAIVEDSLENTDTLKYLLSKSPVGIDLIGTAQSMEEARLLLSDSSLDLALLDIQLREGIIFEVLEEILEQGEINFEIVFVTAHTSFEFATKAIQFACMDYITKPINQERLDELLLKCQQSKFQNNSNIQVEYLLQLIKGNLAAPDSISISLPKGIIEIIQLSELSFIEADGSTCKFNFKDKSLLHSVKPLAHYIELLEGHKDFIQVSRNCVVNKSHVKRYDHRHKTIDLLNGMQIVVSHRHSKHFKAVLLNESKNTGLGGGIQMLKNIFKSK